MRKCSAKGGGAEHVTGAGIGGRREEKSKGESIWGKNLGIFEHFRWGGRVVGKGGNTLERCCMDEV